MSAPIRQLSLSQIPVFLLNSRLSLFSAACLRRHPFSRSYGVILPSSLTRVLSHTLGFSPQLPVSVCGTGSYFLTRSFSWQCDIRNFATKFRSPSQLVLERKSISLVLRLAAWTHISDRVHSLASCVPPSLKQKQLVQEYQPVVHRLRLSASA